MSKLKVGSTQLGSGSDRPVPIGVSVKMPTEKGFGTELAVLEVLKNDQAKQFAESQHVILKALPEDSVYIFARIRVGYYSKARGVESSGNSLLISAGCFQTSTAAGTCQYETPEMAIQPTPGLIGESVSVGESKEGWIALQVPEDASETLLIFHRNHGLINITLTKTWRPFWFRLTDSDPMTIECTGGECRI